MLGASPRVRGHGREVDLFPVGQSRHAQKAPEVAHGARQRAGRTGTHPPCRRGHPPMNIDSVDNKTDIHYRDNSYVVNN